MTAIGQTLSDFTLPDTEGAIHSLPDAPATVIFFTSNQCPFALAWHKRIIDAARDYADRGVPFLAINPNDSTSSPRDSLPQMRERHATEDWGPVPYLRDEEQTVAAAYGAERTPDVFVLDREHRLRYRGTPDEDCEEPALAAEWLRGALDAVLEGREVDAGPSFSVGCPIKWRGRPAHPPGITPPNGGAR